MHANGSTQVNMRHCKSELPFSACRKRMIDLRQKIVGVSVNVDVARRRRKRNLWKKRVGLWHGDLYKK